MLKRVLGGVFSLALISGNAQATDLIFGFGSISYKGALMGMEKAQNSDALSVKFGTSHMNMVDSRWFYDSSVTYTFPSANQSNGSAIFSPQGGTINVSATDFSLSSWDAQTTIGYDLFHAGKHDYVGLGVSFGVNLPQIESRGSQSDSGEGDSTASASEADSGDSSQPVGVPAGESADAELLNSKTSFYGYRIGPKLVASKSMGDGVSFYGEVSYMPQLVNIRNKTFGTDLNIRGNYMSVAVGAKYLVWSRQPQKVGFLNLGPEAYINIGLSHTRLRLDKFNLDLSGNDFDLYKSEFDLRNTTIHIGIAVTLF